MYMLIWINYTTLDKFNKFTFFSANKYSKHEICSLEKIKILLKSDHNFVEFEL